MKMKMKKKGEYLKNDVTTVICLKLFDQNYLFVNFHKIILKTLL